MPTPSKDAAYFDRLYRTGVARSWDRSVPPPEVIQLCEGDSRLPPGRALDLGCGTGTTAVFLAKHGWDVVGIDFVDRALGQARERAAEAAMNVTFLVGDVTRLPELTLGEFDLVVDVGCLHSLSSPPVSLAASSSSWRSCQVGFDPYLGRLKGSLVMMSKGSSMTGSKSPSIAFRVAAYSG